MQEVSEERDEYKLLSLKSEPQFAIEEINRNLNNGLNIAFYRVTYSNIQNDTFFKPYDPDQEFGRPNILNYKEGKYRRFGNILLESRVYGHRGHEGTLYISSKGAWKLITSNGMTVASGSGGINVYAICNFDAIVYHPSHKPSVNTLRKHERAERFEGIL